MTNCENIFENDKIIIWHDLKGYDFEYHIENKTRKKVVYYLKQLDDYLVLESQDYLNFLGDEIDNDYIRSFLEDEYEEYSLLNEVRTIQLEIEDMITKKENDKEIVKYINYRLFWLKDIIEKIEN